MKRRAVLAGVVSAIGMTVWGFVQPFRQPTESTAVPATSAASQPMIRTPPLKVEVIADNLVAPWAIAFLPDGRVMFTERAGRVRIIKENVLQPEPALVVSDIKPWLKMGLLGLVLDPQFETNHYVYVAECYGGEAERDSWERIVRYTFQAEELVAPTTLLDRIPAFWNHSGGRLAFGPDGKLYITTGDSDRPPLSQDLTSLAGKILRLNPDGSVPADNPFVNTPNAHPAIWSYGHRNPQGLAFDDKGTLYAPEHGPEGGDEINVIQREPPTA
jgi:glucose/arabinose dehydrogenase